MKILVTGSSGLVGRAFQKVTAEKEKGLAEPAEYVYLSSKDGDLTNEHDVRVLFETHRPDAIVHLAANVGGLYKNMHRCAAMFEDNLLMNTLLLKHARINGVKRIISVLSTCIFPDGVEPLVEGALHNGPPHPSNEGYAYAKRMLEVHSRILNNKHGVHTVCLVPTNLYGPHDNFSLEDAHVIPALVRKCYEAKKLQRPFVVYGSGRPLRQFLYSEDFAGIIWGMLHSPTSFVAPGSYICSPPSWQEVSIRHVATEVARAFDYEHAMVFDKSYSDGQYKKTVEPNAIFGRREYKPVADGIRETVAWFVDAISNNSVRL